MDPAPAPASYLNQDHRLTDEGLDNLLQGGWKVTPVTDRMGLRHSGPGVKWKEGEQPFGAGSDPSNIVDAGYAVGSIQIPGGTQPIILHRDAVSGGGYAMVARAAPGTSTRFVAASQEEALAARKELAERKKTRVRNTASAADCQPSAESGGTFESGNSPLERGADLSRGGG